MRRNMLIGVILIVLGVVAFAYQGISYTTRGKAVDIGPIQVTTERTRNIPLSPIIGAVALAGGIVLLVTGSKKS